MGYGGPWPRWQRLPLQDIAWQRLRSPLPPSPNGRNGEPSRRPQTVVTVGGAAPKAAPPAPFGGLKTGASTSDQRKVNALVDVSQFDYSAPQHPALSGPFAAEVRPLQ